MAFARRRLLQDYAEIQREPSELISAAPLENNIFEWHVNLRPSSGPLTGVILHLRVIFPNDYPNSPPDMLFPFDQVPSFTHPNLYGFGLCLDILQSYVGHRIDRAGWSSAYSVKTILLQLQSFLFEFDSAPQDHGGSYSCKYQYNQARISQVREQCLKMTCSCGHCGSKPWPSLLPPLPETPLLVTRPQLTSKQELRQVSVDIALAEERIANAQRLREQGRPKALKHTAYLSARDEPKFFRAALHSVCVRVLSTRAGKKSYVRFGYGSIHAASVVTDTTKVMWDSEGKVCFGTSAPSGCAKKAAGGDIMSGICTESSLDFYLNSNPVKMNSKLPLRDRLCVLGTGSSNRSALQQDDVCACLEICNADVCIESEGSTFESDRIAIQPVGDMGLFENALEQGAQSTELLPTLQARQQDLIERCQREVEQQLRLKRRHLQAEVEDLSKHLHEGSKKGPWARLSPDLLMKAFMYLDVVTVAPLLKVCKVWKRLYVRCSLPERLQLCCFYTKATADKDVLGLGISVEYHSDGNIKEVGTELDVVSQEAYFDHKVRRGAWGNTFKYFLPLVLGGSHARHSLPTLKCALASMVLRKPASSPDFQPWMALAVIPQVMNSFTVSLMREEDGEETVPRHASERALQGYCSFHHMLLALRAQHPSIQTVASQKLRQFIDGKRSKADVPDLGQLLVYMTVTEDVAWADLVAALLDESQVRSVRWLLRDMPWLEGSMCVEDRLRRTFRGRVTSLRLIMFQAYFLNFVARPAGESLSAALARYNSQFGQPTVPQKEGLVQACHGILKVDSWSEFYSALELQAPPAAELSQQLCEAIQRSREHGYHGTTLLQSRDVPEKLGVQKSLRHAFADIDRQKRDAELEKLRQKELELRALEKRKQERKAASRVHIPCGRFAALHDSDSED